jgi:hypothetical protein
MDERDNYGYGWSAKGERIHGLKAGRRQGRINMIAGYRDGQLIAPFTITAICFQTRHILKRKTPCGASPCDPHCGGFDQNSL